MSAAGPPQGARPPGGRRRAAPFRGEHASAARLSAALTLALALAACQSLPPPPPFENPFDPPPLAVRVTEGAAGAPLMLARGQTLVVSLPADVSTGYRWEALPGHAPALVSLGTPDLTAANSLPEVGVPGDMAFRFRAAAAGSGVLEMVYQRPFEPAVPPAKSVRYDVTVR